ncbi:dihydropteroate synthase [Salinisphaera sp. C84B14]|uniref:dihydropteroate synthase n=1 Tax=Salinisphaera sp. C84B14 TaxID=1304155 RepID=UPI0032B1935D|tara:strand:- start:79 stop:858 length:780 start_codon:yes stop_codon:yes gene_type:complete
MGILNVTPDSFSDGGAYVETTRAVDHALAMVEQGAAIIDVGGESTRPGADPVDEGEELARVLPVIEALRAQSDVFISIDTVKPSVMRAACAAGADMINDVMALRAPGALEAARDSEASVCLMHMQGEPRTMQSAPAYRDVVADVRAFLAERVAACREAGIDDSRLCVDPGFGFGKTLAHNLALMRRLRSFVDDGLPVLVGVSRKSMFAKLHGHDDMDSRIHASVTAAFWAATQGAGIIRSHDVAPTAEALTLAAALVDN